MASWKDRRDAQVAELEQSLGAEIAAHKRKACMTKLAAYSFGCVFIMSGLDRLAGWGLPFGIWPVVGFGVVALCLRIGSAWHRHQQEEVTLNLAWAVGILTHPLHDEAFESLHREDVG